MAASPLPLPASIQVAPFVGTAYRIVHQGYVDHPESTEGSRRHGGRFNRRQISEALYTSLDRFTARREVEKNAGNVIREDAYYLVEFQVEYSHILDLTDLDTVEQLGLDKVDLESEDWDFCQELAVALRLRGIAGVITWSTANPEGKNLTIFTEVEANPRALEWSQPVLLNRWHWE